MSARGRRFLRVGLLVACTGLVALIATVGVLRRTAPKPQATLDLRVIGGPWTVMHDPTQDWSLALPENTWWNAEYFIHGRHTGAYWQAQEASLVVFSGRRPDGKAVDIGEATDTVINNARAADPTFQELERIPAHLQRGSGTAVHASLSEGGVERESWVVVAAAGPQLAVVTVMTGRERFATIGPHLLQVASNIVLISR